MMLKSLLGAPPSLELVQHRRSAVNVILLCFPCACIFLLHEKHGTTCTLIFGLFTVTVYSATGGLASVKPGL